MNKQNLLEHDNPFDMFSYVARQMKCYVYSTQSVEDESLRPTYARNFVTDVWGPLPLKVLAKHPCRDLLLDLLVVVDTLPIAEWSSLLLQVRASGSLAPLHYAAVRAMNGETT